MRGLGGLARGRGHEDLLQEAIVATLDPSRRRWRKQTVGLVHHLVRTMESISNGWGRKLDFTEEKSETDLWPTDPDEEVEDLIGDLGHVPDRQERQTIAKQDLERLKESLVGDTTALEVLSGMQEDLTGPDIKDILGISETDFQSAKRKVRRHAQSLLQPSSLRPRSQRSDRG
jgi:hypothetical protein